jgi:hypothetical protein
MLYHNFSAYFLVIFFRLSLVSRVYIAVVSMAWIVQRLRLALSKVPNDCRLLVPILGIEGQRDGSLGRILGFLDRSRYFFFPSK